MGSNVPKRPVRRAPPTIAVYPLSNRYVACKLTYSKTRGIRNKFCVVAIKD